MASLRVSGARARRYKLQRKNKRGERKGGAGGFHRKNFIRAPRIFTNAPRARVNHAPQVFISRFKAAPDGLAICVAAVPPRFVLWLRRRTSTSISSDVSKYECLFPFDSSIIGLIMRYHLSSFHKGNHRTSITNWQIKFLYNATSRVTETEYCQLTFSVQST